MFEVKITLEKYILTATYPKSREVAVKAKLLSQMNNGHTVILGDNRQTYINSKYIVAVEFNDKEE